jgi:pyruvate dehydrogenase E1 component alpha subunit
MESTAIKTEMLPVDLNHRTIMQIGRYRAMDLGGIDPDTVRTLFRQMLRLRRTEEALLSEYHPADEMRCPIHFCIGQEAVPAALSLLVEAEDYLFSHHRSHGYYFAKSAPLRELFAEIYGKETGANRGRAGSQDISHHASRFYSGAILAGAISIAAGTAFALQYKKARHISIAGFGEGASDEGAFWETMNYSGLKKLPVLFVCENNRYATYSDQLKRQASDNICERVVPFGVRARRIFGNDVALVYRTLKQEIETIRSGHGPALVEAYTYRWNSHVGPEDDGANAYRTSEEIQFWKNNCPLALLEEKLREGGLLDTAAKEAMERDIAAEIEENFRFAKSSPFPSNPDWHAMNWNEASPMADRLLGTSAEADFDQYQPEAKLEPY